MNRRLARIEIRVEPLTKARWLSLAEARHLSLSAFVTEAVEGSAVPASIRSEIEHQLQYVPGEIKRMFSDDDLLSELLRPLVAARLGDFDPEEWMRRAVSEVRQAVRAEAAQFAGSSPSAGDETGWMDQHA